MHLGSRLLCSLLDFSICYVPSYLSPKALLGKIRRVFRTDRTPVKGTFSFGQDVTHSYVQRQRRFRERNLDKPGLHRGGECYSVLRNRNSVKYLIQPLSHFLPFVFVSWPLSSTGFDSLAGETKTLLFFCILQTTISKKVTFAHAVSSFNYSHFFPDTHYPVRNISTTFYDFIYSQADRLHHSV